MQFSLPFSAANFKLWSALGSRAAYGLAALELGEHIQDLFVIAADTSTSAGLDRFKKKYPEKYLDVGIAEQNMIGIAAGLASEGMTVFTSTFAPFQTLRCCEQIKMNLGYMGHPVKMVGLASGVCLGPLGHSHYAIEDLAITRAIDGLTVISPADAGETVKAVLAAATHAGPVYIRLTGVAKNPSVYKEDYNFEIGKANILREGRDVTIFATGTMVHESLTAATALQSAGISTAVVNLHTLAPFDSSAVHRACATSQILVTVEEHGLIGGLGSAVAEAKAALRNAPPLFSFGIKKIAHVAEDYSGLLERNELTAAWLEKNIRAALKS